MAYTTGNIYVIETAVGRMANQPVPIVGNRSDNTKPERLRDGHGRSHNTLPDGRTCQKCRLATADDVRAWRDAELAGDVVLMDAQEFSDYRRQQWPETYSDDTGEVAK